MEDTKMLRTIVVILLIVSCHAHTFRSCNTNNPFLRAKSVPNTVQNSFPRPIFQNGQHGSRYQWSPLNNDFGATFATAEWVCQSPKTGDMFIIASEDFIQQSPSQEQSQYPHPYPQQYPQQPLGQYPQQYPQQMPPEQYPQQYPQQTPQEQYPQQTPPGQYPQQTLQERYPQESPDQFQKQHPQQSPQQPEGQYPQESSQQPQEQSMEESSQQSQEEYGEKYSHQPESVTPNANRDPKSPGNEQTSKIPTILPRENSTSNAGGVGLIDVRIGEEE